MKYDKTGINKKLGLLALGWAMTTVASIVTAPILLDKYINKQYKSKLRHDNSNIADLNEAEELEKLIEAEELEDEE